ncbi:hypothetical protein TI05_08865 [Achromatium sp. WMS3]|nr:hypothetical protein TI05_08865 [Achromatium sp. WMS3]
MRITKISVYKVELPSKGGGYRRTTGFAPESTNGTVVQIDTDEGITGFGEVCPMGTHYMSGFGSGAQAGIPLLAPYLINENPFEVERLNHIMDLRFKGDNYIKAPIDMALWDIMGKATGCSVCELMGGRYDKPIPLYRTVHLFKQHEDTADMWANRVDDYRKAGYTHFQIKVGMDPKADIDRIKAVVARLQEGEVIIADANAGWSLHGAILVANAVKDFPVIIEQPCATLEECIIFRKHCNLPVKLDELMESTLDVVRAHTHGAMDICAIKIARVGGLTKAKRMRDLCIDLGLSVVPDDAWGSDIVTAAISHFAQSTHSKYLFESTDLTDYVGVTTADGCPHQKNGFFQATDAPGLGITPRMEVLGKPIAIVE